MTSRADKVPESTPYTQVEPGLFALSRPIHVGDCVMFATVYNAHIQTDEVWVDVPADGKVAGRSLCVQFSSDFVAWMRDVNRMALASIDPSSDDNDFVEPLRSTKDRETVRVRFSRGFVATEMQAVGDRIAILDYSDPAEGIRHEPGRDLTLLVTFRGVILSKGRFSFTWTVVSSQKHLPPPPLPSNVLHRAVRRFDDGASAVGDWLEDADNEGDDVDKLNAIDEAGEVSEADDVDGGSEADEADEADEGDEGDEADESNEGSEGNEAVEGGDGSESDKGIEAEGGGVEASDEVGEGDEAQGVADKPVAESAGADASLGDVRDDTESLDIFLGKPDTSTGEPPASHIVVPL